MQGLVSLPVLKDKSEAIHEARFSEANAESHMQWLYEAHIPFPDSSQNRAWVSALWRQQRFPEILAGPLESQSWSKISFTDSAEGGRSKEERVVYVFL